MNPVDFIFAIIETYMTQIPQRFMTNVDKTQAKLEKWFAGLSDSKIKESLDHPLFQTALIFCIPFVGEWIQNIGKKKEIEKFDEYELMNDDENE